MIFSVRDALFEEGELFPLEFEETLDPFEYMGQVSFSGPAKVCGQYFAEGSTVRVRGTITVPYLLECDRCLKPFEKTMVLPFDEVFFRVPEDQDSFVISKNDTIDFQPLVRETVIAGLPIERLCREDCKGLCPYCGIDKNFSSCSCKEPEKENPFSVLRELRD